MKKEGNKREPILYGIIGLLAGVIFAGAVAVSAVNNDNHDMMNMMGMNSDHSHERQAANHDEMSMNEMTEQLKTKSGDDFDKAFIEMMIAHHNGAIAMAELIPDRAKHDEIKELGKDIISAQTNEVSEMYKWQKDWGYGSDEMMQMMHGGR